MVANDKSHTQNLFLHRLNLVKNAEVKQGLVGDVEQTLTEENIQKFVLGQITLAQLYGISMEQAYAVAEIGYNLFEQGKLTDAQTIFEGLVVMNPYDGYFHSVLGSVYARKGDLDSAYREYTIATNFEPVDPQVLVNRAELLLNQGKFKEALVDLKAAIDHDPHAASPAISRAKALASATIGLIEKVLEEKGVESKAKPVPPGPLRPKRKGV